MRPARERVWFSMFLIAGLCSAISCTVSAPLSGNTDDTGASPDGGVTTDGGSTDAPEISGVALPDFSLTDVNANSPRNQQAVSPRDYLGKISAWYFGHST